MNKTGWMLAAGGAALGLTLIAGPGRSATPQQTDEAMQRKLAKIEAKLANLASLQEPVVISGEVQEPEAGAVLLGDEGASWLGVETHDVTAETVKTYKLPAERGVVIGKVIADSPAAKAGLKENDVVTEINGQRVESAATFRRMIREIPAGRTAQLTIWRDGHSQSLSVTLGHSAERQRVWTLRAAPGSFAFRMPEIPEVEIPEMDFGGIGIFPGQPRLGIDAEDLNGQLGAFFGAPDGEGVLVRSVNSGSPAEKAGLRAGDVITSVNGERVRGVGELREKLSAKREDNKATSVKLGVLRNKTELSLTAELPAPEKAAKPLIRHRTNI
jgi:membrane-associated protease RseP (regulator of RpoE activity)